jgi:hypothetical protein
MEDQLGEWPAANLDDAAEEVPNELSLNGRRITKFISSSLTGTNYHISSIPLPLPGHVHK